MDPKHVLVEDHRVGGEGDIYSVDVYTLSAGRIMQGSERYFAYQVDLKGELRARQELNYDNGKVYIAQQIKDPDTGQWSDHFRSYAKDRMLTDIVGFTNDPHVVLIATSKGSDNTGVYEYDIKQRKILEPAFEHKLSRRRPRCSSPAARTTTASRWASPTRPRPPRSIVSTAAWTRSSRRCRRPWACRPCPSTGWTPGPA
ncbi:MAG: hypothetical protein ACHP84_03100 [Caulobacterales bacterium]